MSRPMSLVSVRSTCTRCIIVEKIGKIVIGSRNQFYGRVDSSVSMSLYTWLLGIRSHAIKS